MTANPEEIVLAVRFELGLATRTELADYVDRRVIASATLEPTLLELATPTDLQPEDVARRLYALAGLTDDPRVPRMQIVEVAALLAQEAITLDHAVAYLCARVAPRLEDRLLAQRCGALDDQLYLARNQTWGSEPEVRVEIAALAEDCAAR